MRAIILNSIIILLAIWSCKQKEIPFAAFNEPQPATVKKLENFPHRLIGNYLDVEDSSSIVIEKFTIKKIFEYKGMIHQNEIDSFGSFDGKFIFAKDTNEKFHAEKTGDSLLVHFYSTDTIFNLNSFDVLKKYKGYYFLNSTEDNISWTTKKLRLKKGNLIITTIDSVEDFSKLKQIKESNFDTIIPKYKFKPTKREFKKFIKQDGFGGKEQNYVRTK